MGWSTVLLTVGAPALFGIGGLFSWYVRSRLEEIREAERNLNDERRRVYADVLEPFLLAFTTGNDRAAQRKFQKLLQGDFRRTVFDLSLVGSDDVVQAFGDFMQRLYRSDGPLLPEEMLHDWGGLLLEIRRSVGNQNTRLTRRDMLRGLITDIDQYEIE